MRSPVASHHHMAFGLQRADDGPIGRFLLNAVADVLGTSSGEKDAAAEPVYFPPGLRVIQRS